MLKTGGSIRKLTINGTAYDVLADANFKEVFTKYEIEGVPTSGRTMITMKKRVPIVENIDLGTSGAERLALKSHAESLEEQTFSYTNAQGDKAKCQGKLNIDGNETETNKTTITIIPSTDWEVFVAS